jgi:hypothetical protein
MSAEEPQDITAVLKRAHSDVAAGQPTEAPIAEVELHAPLDRERQEPVGIDSGVEAILSQRLSPGTAE